MPARNEALKERLSRQREITISVTGRKSRRIISIPVWFVLEDERLYLLPVQGSDTQWYQNVLHNALIRVDAGSAKAEFKFAPITDAKQVSAVVEKFRDKYASLSQLDALCSEQASRLSVKRGWFSRQFHSCRQPRT
jgi:hypothetical protein